MELTTILLIALLGAVAALIVALFRRKPAADRELREHLSQMKETVGSAYRMLAQESRRARGETTEALHANRDELSASLSRLTGLLSQQSASSAALQRGMLTDLMQQMVELQTALSAASASSASEQMRVLHDFQNSLSESIRSLREENAGQLSKLRAVVEEQLEQTVERRFDASFRIISDRLEEVHRGLGEMQDLAAGVGDLKRVLSNVKTRGTLGEMQLGSLLEQFLAPEQFVRNAHVVPGSPQHVEFAIRLPGVGDRPLLLPVDSKFPMESYERLQDASDAETEQQLGAQLESALRRSAKDIRDKYIMPPYTTDFAIMFLPAEGLYAELLRRPGLFSDLQNTYRVTALGPANLSAFLMSLQMGFRTLAIEQRTNEVWDLLAAVKREFVKFAGTLEKVQKKLREASNVVEQAGTRTRVLERQLRSVESLSEEEA